MDGIRALSATATRVLGCSSRWIWDPAFWNDFCFAVAVQDVATGLAREGSGVAC